MIKKLWRIVCVRFGWIVNRHECPKCKRFALEWRKIVVLFDDEPPMFAKYVCINPGCRFETSNMPTTLTEKAAQDLRFRDFNDYLEHLDAKESKG